MRHNENVIKEVQAEIESVKEELAYLESSNFSGELKDQRILALTKALKEAEDFLAAQAES